MALLEFVKGPNQGNRHELAGDKIVFGRNAECQVVLNAPAVSREHAVIRKIGTGYFIEDLNSRNGTEVNSVKIKARTPLKDGNQITICGITMVFYEASPKPKLPEHMMAATMDNAEEEDKDGSTVEATIQSSSSKQILEAQPSERLAMLLEVGIELTQTIRTEDLLPKIVDKLFQVFRQADRGFIIIKEDDKLIGKVIRTRREEDDDKTRFSRKIVNRCLDTGQSILSEDASSDSQFDMSQSIADCKIRSMVVAPLMARAGAPAFGVIQLDTQDRFKKFTQDDLRLLMAVAAQAGVALENARMHESLISRAELERDLELAQRVQKSFLPKKFPQVAGYEFFAHYESAQEVGGDYYDFIPLPANRLGVMIGDVAGKGVPAALLMAKVSADARFCTLTEPNLSAAVGKTYEDGCTNEQTGFPLGVVDGVAYDANTITLGPGDCVVLYTDGVTESKSRDEKDFGMAGIHNTLKTGPMTPKAMGMRLVETVQRHATGRKPHDDLTVVTFGRLQ